MVKFYDPTGKFSLRRLGRTEGGGGGSNVTPFRMTREGKIRQKKKDEAREKREKAALEKQRKKKRAKIEKLGSESMGKHASFNETPVNDPRRLRTKKRFMKKGGVRNNPFMNSVEMLDMLSKSRTANRNKKGR